MHRANCEVTINIARQRMTQRTHPGALAARLPVLALLACQVVWACAASRAGADARFGDSTWVALDAPSDSASTVEGPRVAPLDHERRWETALRAPFRLVFFPLRIIARGLEAGAGYVGPRYFEPKAKRPPKPGPVLAPNITIGAANDIGVGPAITWAGFPAGDARLHLAGSWSAIDRRRVRFSETIGYRRPVGFRLGADYDYQPNRRYYGIGNNTPATDLSYFLLTSTNAEAALLFGASPLRQLRIVGGYSSMSQRRGYKAQPLLENVFEPTSAPFEHQTSEELWYGVSGDLAALDDGRDPSRGVHGRLDLRRARGLRSSDPDYYQWQVEGRAYIPVFAKRRVIAVRGVYMGVEPSGGTTTIMPFYRLARSGGASRFAGYASDRFRDRQLMLARIEYRWAILYRLSALGLYELGEVAPHAGSFSLRGTHGSYGGGLRLGLSNMAALRFELAKSVEGLHPILALGSDF
jgi:surface antigen Omp85-like protein